MDTAFTPGPETVYSFVCYSHRDPAVVGHVAWLRERGFDLWYDSNLSAGGRWTDELAQAITDARCVLFFVSQYSTASTYCIDEVQYAKSAGVPILPVVIDDAPLPPGMRLMLGSVQMLTPRARTVQGQRQEMADALAKVLAGPETATPASGDQQTNNGATAAPWHQPALAALAGLLVTAAVVALTY